MTTLKELYEHPEVSVGHRSFFWHRVNDIFSKSEDKINIALQSLCYMFQRYSTGGISAGRSLRSLLLDRLLNDVRGGNFEHARKIIATILAMYHSHEYIEKTKWYDFPLDFGLYGSFLEERIQFSVVALALGAENDIPDISNFTEEDFLNLLD